MPPPLKLTHRGMGQHQLKQQQQLERQRPSEMRAPQLRLATATQPRPWPPS